MGEKSVAQSGDLQRSRITRCGTLAMGKWTAEAELLGPMESGPPDARHLAVLAAISQAGGRCAQVEDAEAAQQSVARAWLSRTPDGGFALTILGAFLAARRAQPKA